MTRDAAIIAAVKEIWAAGTAYQELLTRHDAVQKAMQCEVNTAKGRQHEACDRLKELEHETTTSQPDHPHPANADTPGVVDH